MHLPPNTLLQNGKYRIIKVLGQGGFGITYLAEAFEVVPKALGEMRITTTVAIKEFFPKDACYRTGNAHVNVHPNREELFDNLRKRLLTKESRLTANLKHPNIVNVFETFEENNTAYLVMEYIEGTSLDTMLQKKKPLPLQLVLGYARQITLGLQCAHQKDIVHLDIKPANILVDKEGKVKLIDFGIAKNFTEAQKETKVRISTVSGYTPEYAPPEQTTSAPGTLFTASTDIYSFGATLYQCLTGTLPFEASARTQEEMPSVHQLNRDIPEHISNAITKAMALKRTERYQTVESFMEALTGGAPLPSPPPPQPKPKAHDVDRTKVFDKKPSTTPPPNPQSTKQKKSKNLRPFFIGLLLCLLATGIGFFIWKEIEQKTSGTNRFNIAKEDSLKRETVPSATIDTVKSSVPGEKTPTTQSRQPPSTTPPPVARPEPKKKGPDVYVVGGGGQDAILLKNGIKQRFLDSDDINRKRTEAYSVFVSGNDVYVAGQEGTVHSIARLWKNGIKQYLTVDESEKYPHSAAYSVFIAGNDVYVAGEDKFRATLWKNGSAQRLSDSTFSSAHSVYVSGNDVYVAGYEEFEATLWKNGIAQRLTVDESVKYPSSRAYSVFVTGSDVYVAGEGRNAQGYTVAMLWKNGVAQNLTEREYDTRAVSVFVTGTDVYVAGYEGQLPYSKVAILWKNGIAQILTDGKKCASAHSVYVMGNDVYVVGREERAPSDYMFGKLWKNGVVQNLNNIRDANSVFVTP